MLETCSVEDTPLHAHGQHQYKQHQVEVCNLHHHQRTDPRRDHREERKEEELPEVPQEYQKDLEENPPEDDKEDPKRQPEEPPLVEEKEEGQEVVEEG